MVVVDQLTLHTSIIHQIQNKASETTLGAAIAANLNQDEEKPTSVYLGSWIRFNDAVVPYIGLEFGDVRLGMTYDVNSSSLKVATERQGGIEISLVYAFRKDTDKPLNCPKF